MRSLSIRFLLCSVLLSSPILHAQLPNTPEGRKGNALIALLRSGPSAVTADFFEEHFSSAYLAANPVDERVAWLRGLLEELGELELQGVQKTGELAATIVASAPADGSRLEIAYAVESEPPHGIASLEINRAGEAIAPMSRDAMAAAVASYLDEQADQDTFSGVVLVAHGEDVLFEGAYGLADRRFGAENRPDTPFNLGSINKIFTQIAIAQLAAAGRLSFDDTLAEHLPEYPRPDLARKITIDHLASHTSGLGDIFTEDFARASKARFLRPTDYFELFAEDDLLFEPGEGQSYSNAGYMVLGAIVEAVTGGSYEDYVQKNIFEPAGMSRTAALRHDGVETPFATGYTRRGEGHEAAGPLRENTFLIPFAGTPAGGGYSTARDLLRFRHALVEHRLLDPRYSEWVFSGRLPETASERDGGLGIGVAGGAPGVNAHLELEGGWTMIVLANLDPPSAADVAAQLRAFVGAVMRHESQR